MRYVFCLVIFIFFTIIYGSEYLIHAQENKESKSVSTDVSLGKVVNTKGWEIPLKDDALFEDTEQIELEGTAITVKTFSFRRKFIEYLYEGYFLENDNSLMISSTRIRITALNSFESKGKIFAYRVQFAKILGGEGSRTSAGMIFKMFYYDEDGNGIFETRYTNKQAVDHLPDWIKK